MESKETSTGTLDPQLWQACAGNMVQIPLINSNVFYFPQGHSEHASGNVDFSKCPKISSYIPCKVSNVKFMADQDNDEVFAKIRLIPIDRNKFSFNDTETLTVNGSENQDKSTSFAKTLTQSDANNGGGFSVPRYCAETIFPRLDYTADPPVQSILAKDAHGQIWKFRHIYRGTPRRHLLTTGWSTFVNSKNLVAGDSIVFMRGENGDLCVGIRRAKKGLETRTSWNGHSGMHCGVFSSFLREDENNKMNRHGYGNESVMNIRKVKAEDVIQAVTLAANGQPFEVVYYPRASTPEFCVKASVVKAAMNIRWLAGMRFKMAFETEDSSRISWFMGTISSVQVADPNRWPDSPWRLLMVNWDEPDLLQNVKRVSPWLVELATPNIHGFPVSSYSPPRKKIRLTTHPQEFPFSSHQNHEILGLSSNTIAPAGMQGARHAQYGYSISPSFTISKQQHPSAAVSSACYRPVDLAPSSAASQRDENISCLLRVGNSTPESDTTNVNAKPAPFLLFGKHILTDEQISQRRLNSDVNNNNNKTKGFDLFQNRGCEEQPPLLGLDGHCKVFLESEDDGRSLHLDSVSSYDELRKKVEVMFNIGGGETPNAIVYSDETGAIRQLGDEPFDAFKRSSRRLTILSDTKNSNNDDDNNDDNLLV